jgi:hypothetical protein
MTILTTVFFKTLIIALRYFPEHDVQTKFWANKHLSIALLTMIFNFLSNVVQGQMGFCGYSPLCNNVRYKDVNLNILLSATSTDKYFWAKNALPKLKRLNRQVNGLSYVLHKPCSKFHIRNLLCQW